MAATITGGGRTLENLDKNHRPMIIYWQAFQHSHIGEILRTYAEEESYLYKKVAAGQIRIEGLLEEELPLPLPTHNGERRLKAFLTCQEIKVQKLYMTACIYCMEITTGKPFDEPMTPTECLN